jgi:uncharacterized protein
VGNYGVFHLARVWAHANRLQPSDAWLLEAAALLHDVQTGPFGHSLEYILEGNKVKGDFRHQDISHGASNQFLQKVTANVSFSIARFSAVESLGDLWPEVALVIRGGGRFGPLISGTIDRVDDFGDDD